tara:strand:+ start:78 stop:626 length:549 start_codon:yes stop_codon:yes gene_type:complete
MGILLNLCTPALVYFVFSLTQIAIDIFKYENNRAFFKAIVMIIFTTLLNILCSRGLGIVSWIIVFVPFMLMSFITTILLVVFGLDPSSGKMKHKPMYKEKPRYNVENHRHRQHRNRKPRNQYDQDFAPISPSIDTSPQRHVSDARSPQRHVRDARSPQKISPKSPPPPMTTSIEEFKLQIIH